MDELLHITHFSGLNLLRSPVWVFDITHKRICFVNQKAHQLITRSTNPRQHSQTPETILNGSADVFEIAQDIVDQGINDGNHLTTILENHLKHQLEYYIEQLRHQELVTVTNRWHIQGKIIDLQWNFSLIEFAPEQCRGILIEGRIIEIPLGRSSIHYDYGDHLSQHPPHRNDLNNNDLDQEALCCKSMAILTEIQSLTRLGNWEYDPQTQKSIWSREIFNIFGYDPNLAEPILADILSLYPPEAAAQLMAVVENVLEHGGSYQLTLPAFKVDGTPIYIECRGKPEFDSLGRAVRLFGTLQDVTEREQIASALRESQHLINRITEVTPNFLYIYDLLASKNVYANRSVFETLGYTAEEIQAMGVNLFPTICHPDDLPVVYEGMTKCHDLRDGEIIELEYRIRDVQGRWRWLRTRDLVFNRTSEGKVQQILGTSWDVTEEKEYAIALAAAKEAAESATKTKSEFLANMSHEIRTPMNGVLGMAQLLFTTPLNDEQQEFVQTIQDSGEILLTVINDILDFSKIEAGMLTIVSRPMSVQNLMRSTLKLLLPQAQAKNLRLNFHISPNVPATICGDSSRLTQVLLNLVSNAIKFTTTGEVSICLKGHFGDHASDDPSHSGATSKLPTSKPHIMAPHQFNQDQADLGSQDYKLQDYKLIFSVQDTGIGINATVMERLFEPFTQADNSASRSYGGTGLGLAISRRLVELMGGKIWVESLGYRRDNITNAVTPTTYKSGSEFHFTVKVQIPPQVKSNVAPSKSMDTSQGFDPTIAQRFPLRILIVEDNLVNQKITHIIFRKLGYQPDLANDGCAAITQVEHHDYDLILMDLHMPNMDGLTATKVIRSMSIPQPHIVAMTADVMPEEQATCLAAGMNQHIGKPVRVQELIQLITNLHPSAAQSSPSAESFPSA